MTDREKLEKIKELADAMYHAAQYLTTDASSLHKAMDEYHQFIVNEYHKKESGEDLESWDKFSNIDDAIDNYCCHDGNIVVFTESLNGEPLDDADDREEVGAAFKAGANWQLNKIRREYEKNRG